jgi:hypothetical protein
MKREDNFKRILLEHLDGLKRVYNNKNEFHLLYQDEFSFDYQIENRGVCTFSYHNELSAHLPDDPHQYIFLLEKAKTMYYHFHCFKIPLVLACRIANDNIQFSLGRMHQGIYQMPSPTRSNSIFLDLIYSLGKNDVEEIFYHYEIFKNVVSNDPSARIASLFEIKEKQLFDVISAI